MDGRRSETLRRRGNGRDWARMTLWRNPDRPGAEGATPISRSGIPANLSGKRTERASSFRFQKGRRFRRVFFRESLASAGSFFIFIHTVFFPDGMIAQKGKARTIFAPQTGCGPCAQCAPETLPEPARLRRCAELVRQGFISRSRVSPHFS